MLPRMPIFHASLKRIFTLDPLSTKTQLTVALGRYRGMSRLLLTENIKMLELMASGLLIEATILGFLQAAFLSFFLVFPIYSCSPYMQFTLGNVTASKCRAGTKILKSFGFSTMCFGSRTPGDASGLRSIIYVRQCLFKVRVSFFKIFYMHLNVGEPCKLFNQQTLSNVF